MADLVALILLGLFASLGEQEPSVLARLQAGEPLRIATRTNAATFIEGPRGPVGLEASLVAMFAQSLGARVEYVLADSPGDVIALLRDGSADIAAAGLTVTPRHTAHLRTGPGYQSITEHLVYREGEGKPASVDDLADCGLVVAAGSGHVDSLERLRWSHPFLRWREVSDTDTDELLEGVATGRHGCTLANSNEVTLARRFLPQLSIAFDVGAARELAWLMPQRTDDRFYLAVSRFFSQLRRGDRLAQVLEQHYGNAERFDYVSAHRLHRHTAQRLPSLMPLFKEAGAEFGIDWRLLAAVGYQESHWDAQAQSPTGVRGIMMLTEPTATQLGVQDRLDPRQSIFGGARYIRRLKGKIPDRIAEPDRTWLALAAYNIGYGHLEDARVITQRSGGDPDRWQDVREHLPLLSDPEWHESTRHGYARGGEPVRYVANIRHYYEILLWVGERGTNHLQVRSGETRAALAENEP